ncbi:cupin domain-containing protein [Sanguibacter sp. 25GB23B1]|uniref:cupin domain-containing protein n=1 Tax=unclassified Sanguibacter TaxID=2645534 RepID=UPI0032AEE051
MTQPPFPGGTSVSLLTVYDWPTTDGEGLVGGGTPHLHTASAEGYVVLRGSGSVQTLGPDGFDEHRLVPGGLLWFEPGIVHRLLNDGDLEILVVMSNAGLPEAGDAVMTFPPDVLHDAERYSAAASLPGLPEIAGDAAGDDGDHGTAAVAAAARARRDLAVEGFGALRERVEAHGAQEAMADLYASAARLVQSRVPQWRERWESTVLRQTQVTDSDLAALARGDGSHLLDATVASAQRRAGQPRFGMCGRLQTWPL